MIVGNGSEAFVWDVFSNRWHSEGSVPVLLLSHHVPAVWLHALAEVGIWLHLSLSWLAMDAPGGVPWVSSDHILDSMNEVSSSIVLTLAEVFGFSEDVRGDSFLVLDSLLNNDSLGVLLLVPLCVESESCSIENSLLTVAESVVCWVELPVVFSLLLLTWGIVSMGLSVHGSGRGVVCNECSSNWVEHFFGALEALGWHTKLIALVHVLRPVVLSREAFAKGLSIVACVLSLLDIVELVRQTCEGLSLDHGVDWVGSVSALSITVVVGVLLLVCRHSPVLLDLAGLVHVGLSIFLQVLRGWRSVHVDILTDAEVSIFTVPHSNNLVACATDLRDWVIVNSH